MKEQSLSRFEFPEESKEKLVELVVYKNVSAAQVAKKYDLPNIHILINWINNYKSNLAKEAGTLLPLEKPKTNDTVLLKKRIKDLEKALEKAKVLIYGLNAMIVYIGDYLCNVKVCILWVKTYLATGLTYDSLSPGYHAYFLSIEELTNILKMKDVTLSAMIKYPRFLKAHVLAMI